MLPHAEKRELMERNCMILVLFSLTWHALVVLAYVETFPLYEVFTCAVAMSNGREVSTERDMIGTETQTVTVQLLLQLFFKQEAGLFVDCFSSLKCLFLCFLSPPGFRFYECDRPADWQCEAFHHHDTVREGEPQVTLLCFYRTDCCFLHPLLSCVQSGDLILVLVQQFH